VPKIAKDAKKRPSTSALIRAIRLPFEALRKQSEVGRKKQIPSHNLSRGSRGDTRKRKGFTEQLVVGRETRAKHKRQYPNAKKPGNQDLMAEIQRRFVIFCSKQGHGF
jgi:hypothetical protein